MKIKRFFYIVLLSLFCFDLAARDDNRPSPGLLIRSDLIRQKRKKVADNDGKEFGEEYAIGKISLGSRTDHDTDTPNPKLNSTTSISDYSQKKESLFKAILDEVENYPIEHFSDKLYMVVTGFYDPLSGKSNTKVGRKIKIRIVGDKDLKISVKAFKYTHNDEIVEDPKFASAIEANIMRRYKREFGG